MAPPGECVKIRMVYGSVEFVNIEWQGIKNCAAWG